MANSGPAINVGGEDIFGYYGLAEETEALIRKLAVETRTLQPDEAASFDVRRTFLIAIGEDVGGNRLVAFRAEYPINPNAQEPTE